MKNIDRLFTTDLINYGLPPYIDPIIPGINDSRKRNENGDLIIDFALGRILNKFTKINFIIKNITNAEIYTRPTDASSPRQYLVKIDLSI